MEEEPYGSCNFRWAGLRSYNALNAEVIKNDNQIDDSSAAVETVLKFQRNRSEFHSPRY